MEWDWNHIVEWIGSHQVVAVTGVVCLASVWAVTVVSVCWTIHSLLSSVLSSAVTLLRGWKEQTVTHIHEHSHSHEHTDSDDDN